MASGTSLDLTSMYNDLQEEFVGGIEDLNNNDLFLYNMIGEASGVTFDGKHAVHAVNIRRAASYQPVPQVGGNYPAAGSPNPLQTMVPQCFSAGTILVEKQARLKTSVHAFVDAWTLSYDSFLQDLAETKERRCVGNGSGVINPLGGIGSVTSVTAANWTFTMSIWDSVKLNEGSRFTVWTCPTALNSTNWRNATKRDTPTQGWYTVANKSISASGGTATITVAEASPGTSSPASGGAFALGSTSNLDFIVPVDAITQDTSGSTTNLGFEPMGLDGIVNGPNGVATSANDSETGVQWLQVGTAGTPFADDTFQNLSPVTYAKWNSTVIPVHSHNTTLQKWMLTQLHLNQNVFGTRGTSAWTALFGHPAQIGAYANTLEPAERYTIAENTPSGSTLGSGRPSLHEREGQGPHLMFAGKTMYASRYIRPDRLYAVNSEGIQKYTLQPWSFDEPHKDYGGRIADQMEGLEAYNMGTRDRAKCAVIQGLKVPDSF